VKERLIKKTVQFYNEHAVRDGDDENNWYIEQDQFKRWVEMFPFIRTLIREALMPRVWTLQSVYPLALGNQLRQGKAKMNHRKS
jgi:hypothetical protein